MKKILFAILIMAFATTAIAQKASLAEVQFGAYGGISGQKNGYSLQFKKGAVQKVTQALQQEPISEQLFQAKRRQVRKIKKYIFGKGLLNLSLSEPGNMTYYLLFIDSKGERIKELNWADINKVPAEVRDLYTLLEQFVLQHQP